MFVLEFVDQLELLTLHLLVMVDQLVIGVASVGDGIWLASQRLVHESMSSNSSSCSIGLDGFLQLCCGEICAPHQITLFLFSREVAHNVTSVDDLSSKERRISVSRSGQRQRQMTFIVAIVLTSIMLATDT
jgi:hypothetical protein